MACSLKASYININNVPTFVMTWGRWIEDCLDDIKEIVICITGNPGLPGFYSEFASTIHKNLGCDTPIWVIGHTGHDEPSNRDLFEIPKLKNSEQLYNLSGQVKHKIDFIQNYVPKNVKIYLVGHSIGAWIVLELLKDNSIKECTKKSYLLFPTIERMATSSNGKIFELCRSFTFVYILCLQLLHLFPVVVRFLISFYFWLFSIPKIFKQTAFKYSKPSSMQKVIFLATDEMDRVKKLDEDHIKNVKHLIKLYYGNADGWVPVQYYRDIKQKIPDLDVELCKDNISHSFVLHHSEIMGQKVTQWIKIDQKN